MSPASNCARRPAPTVVDREHGGKELHDDALLNADLAGSVFALGVLAARDMGYLWDMIVGVAAGTGPWPRATVPAGSAIRHGPGRHPPHPKVWAAVVRVMTVPRSLVAYERGALGRARTAPMRTCT